MSNSFRVGSISASMDFGTAGFMQGVRDVVTASSGMGASLKATGAQTIAATGVMAEGMRALATQAGLTSGTMGLLGKQVASMALASNLSVAGMIARFVALRSEAVITARALDKANAAKNASRSPLTRSDTTGILRTDNEASAMAELTSGLSGMTAMAGKAAMGIAGVGLAAAVAARALKPAIDAALEFEHSFAFVRKTVDGTVEQLDAMAESIRGMSLEVPIAVTELNGVAAAAGQLGIAREDVIDFTRVMAEMGVATDMTAEQAAVGFAQWANITGMASDDVDNLTSAVVHLGNNTATTESAIMNMGLRLAGAARVVGVTDAEMAGLSASLSSLGIWAESGGNAMSRTMYDMQKAVSTGGDELKLFASVAGKSADEFVKQFQSAPMDAVVDFVGGIAIAGKDANTVLTELGITEMESQRALIGLAGGHDKLAHNIRESTRAFQENNARSKETNTLFQTGVSQTQLLKNASHNLAIEVGSVLAPAYEGMIGILTRVFNGMTMVAQKYKETIELQGQMAGQEPILAPGMFGMPDWQKPSVSEDAMLNNILNIQKAGYVAKQTKTEVEQMQKAFASNKYKDDVMGMRDLVDSDVFQREAAKAIEIFKAVPDEITKEMRSAKFEDIWRSTRDGFKSVADAAKQIPAEFQSEFISAAGVVESELAKKGKSGGVKLADEAGKAFEQAMEEAMNFRLDLFPEEAFAEDVRKITKMAQTFPDIMTGDAVGKAFDDLLVQFEGKGINAVEAIKQNIVGLAPAFAKEMENAVNRAKTLSIEAMMEARDEANPDPRFESVGRGRELANSLSGADIAIRAAQDVEDLKAAGRMDGETMNLLAADYWQTLSNYSAEALSVILTDIQNVSPALAEEIKRLANTDRATKVVAAMGEVAGETAGKLRELGATGLANVISKIGSVTNISIGMVAKIKEMPNLFSTFADGATTAAIKVATAMHIALNVIALIADAIALVTSLFGGMGDEGTKELKGMAKVIDEIKEASDAWIDSLTDKLVDAIKTGQFAWNDFVDQVLDDLLKISIRELVVSPITNFVGGMLGFAEGGAFEKGHVVSSPEYFNTKSGPAVRGEAGTEVVMPAVRLGDGTLGVRSAGGGGSTPIININDYRSADSPPIEVKHSRLPDGQEVYDIIVRAVTKAAAVGDLDRVLDITQRRRGYA